MTSFERCCAWTNVQTFHFPSVTLDLNQGNPTSGVIIHFPSGLVGYVAMVSPSRPWSKPFQCMRMCIKRTLWRFYGLAKIERNPFFNPESKLFFASGAISLGLIWWGMNILLGVIGNPLGSDSSEEEYFLLLSFTSLLITHLLGYLVFTMISIDSIVQSTIRSWTVLSMTTREENLSRDPRQNFTNAQWVRLSITQHLDLLEVAGTRKKQATQLKLMLQNIKPNEDPLQYADTATMLSKKLTSTGEFEEAESMCRNCLENLLPSTKPPLVKSRPLSGSSLSAGENSRGDERTQ